MMKSEAAATLGRIKSERKTLAARQNAQRPRPNGRKPRKQRPLEAFTCTCGQCPDNPKTYCPRGRAIIRRRAQTEGLAQAQGETRATGATQ